MNDMDRSAASTAEIPAPRGMKGGPAPAAWGGLAIHPLVGAFARTRGWWRVEPVPAREWDGTLQVRECLLLATSLSALPVFLPTANCAILLTAAVAAYAIGESSLRRSRRLGLLILLLGVLICLSRLRPAPPMPYIFLGAQALEAFFILRCAEFAMSRHADIVGLAFRDRFGRFLLWIFFFPTIFVGPVASYREFYRGYFPEIANWTRTVIPNTGKIMWGAVKYAWLAPHIRRFSSELMTVSASGPLPATLVFPMPCPPRLLVAASMGLDLIAFYLVFSGFTDMAIGVARLFGFNLAENFDRPLLSASPLRYWKTSNISTYRWLMSHIFFPYWGHRQVTAKVLTTFLMSALWHCIMVPAGHWEGMLQVVLALTIFGVVVAASLHASRAGWALPFLASQGRWARILRRGGGIALTFAFLALVHQLFLNGVAGRPLGETWEAYRRLFVGAR